MKIYEGKGNRKYKEYVLVERDNYDAKTMYYIMHHQCMLLEYLRARGV